MGMVGALQGPQLHSDGALAAGGVFALAALALRAAAWLRNVGRLSPHGRVGIARPGGANVPELSHELRDYRGAPPRWHLR